MGFETIPPLQDLVVDKSEVETSQVVGCGSIVTERVETNLSKEPFLLVPLENKEEKGSPGLICYLENNKVDVPEAISPRGDILELSISTKPTDDNLSLGCETPRESIFDPFAPGPEEAACAPKKKMARGVEVPPRRKLNFDSDGPLDGQQETGKNVTDSGLHGSCKTPDSKPLLTGIASTCPGAPLRPSLKALKLSPDICRKIDFDAVSDSNKENN
ncbi:hypothetical protein BDA96_06G142500 [Sorghum bicolor]|uniref:Uncharacterized protein n=2 Tax=Sorghum bicolor TaxID=4558 RepID=A0A921QRC0_SORBI|nr:uncharacterized protein LOC8060177 isoform X2 [Sorghum bicolor]EES12417.2 hypothetical protein SORBI_3006G128800 [Sorghum bicolor]KAG0526398.1 hypothetical protein BDA96_06G142500 [Sorghum bicolor]|eukprot:XP_021319643.1 uncharacterized protein LOC8060177 isoform X2 [Sorghum bicolor]